MENVSYTNQVDSNSNSTLLDVPYISTFLGTAGVCATHTEIQHWLFQAANGIFWISYAIPTSKYSLIIMHALLIFGFLLLTAWAWRVVCAPDIFTWNLAFLGINAVHLVYIIYQMRPVYFNVELEEAYHTLFRPFKVSRLQFKKLVSEPFAQIMSLHAGEAYAIQNITRTDRLGLLLRGKANVQQDHQFLHSILPCEFLDSPEFESRVNDDDKFKVSIIAAVPCRYLYWQRAGLEYLFVKETYLATVIATLVASDITTKLFAMNTKVVTDKGSHLDIRLPSITLALASRDRSTSTTAKKHSSFLSNLCNASPESIAGSHENLLMKEEKSPLPNGRISEMTTVDEMSSSDESSSATEVDAWLDSNSKYHSCELIDG